MVYAWLPCPGYLNGQKIDILKIAEYHGYFKNTCKLRFVNLCLLKMMHALLPCPSQAVSSIRMHLQVV
jgi:hypothetical protein